MRDPSRHIVHYNPGEPPEYEKLDDGVDASAEFMRAAERLPTPLYQISAEWHMVLLALEEGEIGEPQAEAKLKAIAGDFKNKALAAAAVIRNMESAAGDCEAEVQRLQARQKRLAGRAAWLRAYVQREMESIGQERIDGGVFTLALRANNPHVEITDAGSIPRVWWRFRPTPEPEVDKVGILNHWRTTGGDDGGQIPPGTSIERRVSLHIS